MSAAALPSSSTDEAKNGAEVVPVKTFKGHKYGATHVAWYPDERKIVSGSHDGELRIWDVDTSEQVGEAIKGHDQKVWALDVSPDGTRIASGSGDGTIKLWDSKTGKLIHTCKGHKSTVKAVCFSPDSKRLASGSEDQTWCVWDGELAFEPVKCEGAVCAVSYSPSGDRIASGADNIQIWNVSPDGSVSLVLAIKQTVWSLAWTHNGEQLIAGGFQRFIIRNLSLGEENSTTWLLPKSRIQLSLSQTTGHLAICGPDVAHQTAVFDTDTGEQITAHEHDDTVNCVAYSPSGKFLVTACNDGMVYLWEAPPESPVSPHALSLPASSVLDVSAHVPLQMSAR